jgi:hypothetical protein
VRGGIERTLELGYQFGNGAVQIASDVPDGPPVMRLLWLNSNGLK